MEEEDLEQQKQAEAAQKTAHVAGKAAATYFGGGAGAKAYDMASQTAVGQELEKAAGNRIQNNPALNKASQKLNDSGALDAADKGMDLASGGTPSELPVQNGINSQSNGGLGGLNTGNTNNKSNTSNGNNTSNDSNSSSENSNNSSNISGDGLSSGIFGNNKKKKIITIISAVAPFFFTIVLVLFAGAMVMYPIEMAIEYIRGIWDNVVNFFTGTAQEAQEKYYEELKSVQTDISKKYDICIDINLITATLLVRNNFEDSLIDGEKPIDEEDVSYSDSDSEDEGSVKKMYKKMNKQVRLLANMQFKTKKYGLNKDLKDSTGYYCSNPTLQTPVTADTVDSYYKPGFNTDTILDSSSAELVASNDKNGLFTKRVNEEVNYEFNLYQPPFDSEGNCSEKYAKDMLPSTQREISIGDYSTRTESVYYWNLINYFVPNYYKDYLPSSDAEDYERKVIAIADDIYLLYDQYGPSQTCAASYQGPSSLCPNGITIEGEGTIDFEEYVAGVVSREAYTSEGIEALKAQAVAARTYAIKVTDYCQKTISNSTNAQTFTKNINDAARQAANATAGEVLIDSNGKIFASQYDSFCYDDSDCPDAKKNADGTYTVTYTKVPNGEKHVVTLSDTAQYGRITHGHGHAHGMSQLVSYQMAKEGKSYQEILSYFYSDGVTISLVLSPTTTDGATIINRPLTQYLNEAGVSINDMNQVIYDQVRKAGVSTRAGVVAAGVTLINNFYSQTGHILPYELYPSGKYSGYGMDPSWGTNTGRTDYPSNGLDCSGFISWAVHNGGYLYEVKSAKGWGDSGDKRKWFKGTTDSSAKPGDLIYNAPQSANGTTGHIRMIVDVTKDGYVVAEASGRKNGVRITTISFTSTGSYYLVNMDSYYANSKAVTDYPQ